MNPVRDKTLEMSAGLPASRVSNGMKLVIATPLYPPEIGGPATYAKLLEEGLPKQGISVEVVKFSDVRRLPNAIRHIAYCQKILNRARNADAILALDALSVGWPVYFANLFLRKPFFVKIVGDHVWEQGAQRFGITGMPDEFPRFSWRWNPYLWFLRGLQFLVVHNARVIIVPSEYLKGIVMQWGIPAEKISVIYNGVELPGRIPEHQKKEGEFLIVSAGRRVPWKGFEAIERVAERHANWRVYIASGLPRVEALGWIKSADVFVLNSRYEGLSHVLIEAMTLGTPVIATDAGGNATLVVHEETGLLIPPGDDASLERALAAVEHDSAAAKKRARAAQRQMEDFSVLHMLLSTAELLKHPL